MNTMQGPNSNFGATKLTFRNFILFSPAGATSTPSLLLYSSFTWNGPGKQKFF